MGTGFFPTTEAEQNNLWRHFGFNKCVARLSIPVYAEHYVTGKSVKKWCYGCSVMVSIYVCGLVSLLQAATNTWFPVLVLLCVACVDSFFLIFCFLEGCVLVVSVIEQLAQWHNSTVKAAVERLCDYIPGKYQKMCHMLCWCWCISLLIKNSHGKAEKTLSTSCAVSQMCVAQR